MLRTLYRTIAILSILASIASSQAQVWGDASYVLVTKDATTTATYPWINALGASGLVAQDRGGFGLYADVVSAITQSGYTTTITNAEFLLYNTYSGGSTANTLNVYRITQDWPEGDPTMIAPPAFDTSISYGSMTFAPAVAYGELTISCTGLVQSWVNGTPNYGAMLQFANNGTYAIFDDRTVDGGQPQFYIQYTQSRNVPAIAGTITLGNFNNADPELTPVKVQVIQNGTVVASQLLVLTPTGSYSFQTIPAGTYQITFKASHFLSQTQTAVVTNPGTTSVNATLINGDIDGDNFIGALDVSVVSSNFDQAGN